MYMLSSFHDLPELLSKATARLALPELGSISERGTKGLPDLVSCTQGRSVRKSVPGNCEVATRILEGTVDRHGVFAPAGATSSSQGQSGATPLVNVVAAKDPLRQERRIPPPRFGGRSVSWETGH